MQHEIDEVIEALSHTTPMGMFTNENSKSLQCPPRWWGCQWLGEAWLFNFSSRLFTYLWVCLPAISHLSIINLSSVTHPVISRLYIYQSYVIWWTFSFIICPSSIYQSIYQSINLSVNHLSQLSIHLSFNYQTPFKHLISIIFLCTYQSYVWVIFNIQILIHLKYKHLYLKPI